MYQVLAIQTGAGYQVNQITGNVARFQNATFFPIRSFTSGVPAASIQAVYVGFNSGQLPYVLTSGQSLTITAPEKVQDSLNNMYYSANSGDGLFVVCHN